MIIRLMISNLVLCLRKRGFTGKNFSVSVDQLVVVLKLEVVCMDGMHAVFPTLSPFKWERWLKPFGAEVVSLL